MKWTHEMELQLAERVIRATREGVSLDHVWKTLADEWQCETTVFEDRWKKDLKKHYLKALEIAEKAYQLRRMMVIHNQDEKPANKAVKSTKKTTVKPKRKQKKAQKQRDEVDVLIAELRKWKKQKAEWAQLVEWKKEQDMWEKKAKRLEKENEQLQQAIHDLKQGYEEMKTDYSELMRIVSRASHMTDAG